MRILLEVARSGCTAAFLHPLRSLVSIVALVAVLLPYLACLGISQGLQEEAEDSVRFGADLYVTARQFGRNVPIPLSIAEKIQQEVPGVVQVVPRIVGSVVLGKHDEQAVLVGIPREHFPEAIHCVQGQLTEGSRLNELVLGTELAQRLGLKVGSRIPSFYHNSEGERSSRVVGLFRSEVGIWQAKLIFTSFETAAHIFNQKGTATDLLVSCRSNYQAEIANALFRLRLPAGTQNLRLHVLSRDEVAALFRGGLMHREGVFNLHFLLAFSVCILVVLVTSGFGLSERRREIGILKATGWQTDQILLRSAAESVLIALIGISLSVVLAFLWLKCLNGYGIASIFLTGVNAIPDFQIPFRLAPIPVLLGFLIGLIVVLTGSVVPAWRAATTSPLEAMR